MFECMNIGATHKTYLYHYMESYIKVWSELRFNVIVLDVLRKLQKGHFKVDIYLIKANNDVVATPISITETVSCE